MPETTEAYDFRGRTVVDSQGEKIGKVDELYYDQEGGQPEWALINTGLFGTKKTFVPIRGARPTGEDLQVPIIKEQVKDAPRIDADQELSEQEERRLFEHYDVPYTTEGSTTARGASEATRQSASEATGRRSDKRDRGGDDAMTRSEEELRVGTRQQESGRVRLRKFVVTEQVQKTVPVSREEVRVEREPITEANREQAVSGPEITESEHEVVLHEEEPVVEKRVVPKERVRLDKDTVTDEREISEEVRKEQIESEGAGEPRRGGRG